MSAAIQHTFVSCTNRSYSVQKSDHAQMQVYAIATEDMDALTFATPRLIRHLCAAQSAKLPIEEYDYDKVLEGLKLTADQFVDLCILCGCDYCGSIKGSPCLSVAIHVPLVYFPATLAACLGSTAHVCTIQQTYCHE